MHSLIIPIMFTALYDIQKNVIDDNLIPQYIFGKKLNTQEGYNTDVGEIIAYQTLSSFTYSCSDDYKEGEEQNEFCDAAKGESYMNMLSYSMSYMKAIPAGDITVYSGDNAGQGALIFHGIGGVFGGAIVLYQLILMTLDMALRSVKLGVLEMMVPIVLGAFIFKREILGKWFKEFISTYISIFLRLIVLTILVEAMSKLEFINTFLKGNPDYVGHPLVSGILRLVLIMGILRLVKEIPSLVSKIFGVEIKDQGGIGGRLGQMAGVGGLAQNAWKSLTSHPIQKAGKLVTGAVSAVGGAAAHIGASASRTRRLLNSGDERGAILSALGGVFTAGGAAIRGAREGAKNGLSAIGAQRTRYNQLHPNGSTFLGRTADTLTSRLGFGTAQERYEAGMNDINYDGRVMTVEQLNNMRSEQDAILQRRNGIRDAAMDAVTAEDTNLKMSVAGLGSGTYQQLVHNLEGLRNSAPIQAAGESDLDYQTRVQQFQQRMTDLENNLIRTRDNTRDAIMDFALQHNGNLGNLSDGTEINGIRIEAINDQANIIPGRDIGITQTNYSSLEAMNVGGTANLADLTNIANAAQANVNDIDIAIQSHQQRVYQEQNSDEGRRRQANSNASNSRNGSSNNNKK